MHLCKRCCSANQSIFWATLVPHAHHLLDPYKAHLDNTWQFQIHAWQRASAEWSSAPIEPLWKRSCSGVFVISHRPFCVGGMLAHLKCSSDEARRQEARSLKQTVWHTVDVGMHFLSITTNAANDSQCGNWPNTVADKLKLYFKSC